MTSTPDLSGRTALITGARRGVGLAVAHDLAGLGVHVILSGRDAAGLQKIAAEISAAGGAATALPGDICDPSWPEQLRAHAVDILVHSAAAYGDYGPLEERSEDELQAVLNTSLIAALRITAAILPHMKSSDYGRLVYIGSRAASLGARNKVLYAAAKGGLEAMARSLTDELRERNVTANVIEPGLIDTERTRESTHKEARDSIAAGAPAGRIGTAADVAAAVRYLVSPAADFVRGTTLRVDGGLGLGIPQKKL